MNYGSSTDPVAPGTRGQGMQWAQHNAAYRNMLGQNNLAQRSRPDIKSMVSPAQRGEPTVLPPYFGGGKAATPATPGGQAGAGGGGRGQIAVDTSVEPTGVYSNQQTNEARNLAMAQASQRADPAGMIEDFARPGISATSPGIQSLMVPQMAGAQAGGALAGQMIPFQDALTNAQHLLSGQVAREQEGLGMAGVLGGLDLATQRAGLQGQMGLMSMLQQLIGV